MKRVLVALVTLAVLGWPCWCDSTVAQPVPQLKTRMGPLPGAPPPPGSVPYGWLWDTEELRPQWALPVTGVGSTSAFDWSPDGAVLLFAQPHQGRSRLLAISLRGMTIPALGRAVGLIDVVGLIDMVRWSPNSTYVAYHVSGVQDRFVVLRVTDGHLTNVAEAGVLASGMEWSPDSRRLVAAVSLGGTQTEVRVWQLDGTAAHELCRVPGTALYWYDPVWSADGERIMVRDREGARVIVSVRDGQPVYRATDARRAVSASPNLLYLIVATGDAVVIADVQTGERRPVVLEGPLRAVPEWSALQGPVWFDDGIAFAISHAGLLWVVDATTGRGRSTGPRQALEYPKLDRTRLAGGVAYHQGTENPALNGLYLLHRPTDEPRRILDESATRGDGEGGSEWEWSPDGKWGTYVISTPADLRDNSKGTLQWQLLLRVRDGKLYHLSMEGWTPRPLRRLAWSPARSEALVWSDQGASLLTLPK